MPVQHHTFHVETPDKYALVDITDEVNSFVRSLECIDGMCAVFTPHATAAVTVNENDDHNIGVDLLRALDVMDKEHDGWLHDRVDNNATAHIEAGHHRAFGDNSDRAKASGAGALAECVPVRV